MPDDPKPLSPEEVDAIMLPTPRERQLIATVRDREQQRDSVNWPRSLKGQQNLHAGN